MRGAFPWRTYPNWAKEDFARFQNMMLTIFYPMNHDFLTRNNTAAITNYWAKWNLCNMASAMAIGVLCDRRDLYDEAISYFKTGVGNGAMDKAVYYVHPGYLDQWQEAGRDQGHTTLGIALMRNTYLVGLAVSSNSEMSTQPISTMCR